MMKAARGGLSRTNADLLEFRDREYTSASKRQSNPADNFNIPKGVQNWFNENCNGFNTVSNYCITFVALTTSTEKNDK